MALHSEFVSLKDYCPQIIIAASYATTENFTGEVVRGYKASEVFLAKTAAQGLALVQKEALKQGLSLKVFDGYRPAKAVAFFQEWCLREETNLKLKAHFYPGFSRKDLFDLGFLVKKSAHSRGSAVDLSLVDIKTGKELDMGGEFDFFHALSSTDSPLVTDGQRKNRHLLKNLMEGHGFHNYHQEWWHYTFRPEPFPETYFDFDIE